MGRIEFDVEDDTPAGFQRFHNRRDLFQTRKQTNTNDPVSSCLGKLVFQSSDAAAKALRRKPNIDGRRIYRCRYCHQFHIGADTSHRMKE